MEFVKDPKTGFVHCASDAHYLYILQKRSDDAQMGEMKNEIAELKRLVGKLINN